MLTHFPSLITDDVISIVDMKGSPPAIIEGVTDQLKVARSIVVLPVSEHCAVQVTKILRNTRRHF